MPTTQERAQQKELEQHEREALNAVIGEQVVHMLGGPGDLLRVQVRPLWGHYYRANVYVGKDVTSARIGNSYFMEVDGAGNIVASTPKLTNARAAESRRPCQAKS
jgi:hypothetical protein